jgi:hypothetical protein
VCAMILATGLTVVYHRLLCTAVGPYLSFSLKDTLVQDATPFPLVFAFLHKALASIPALRIPRIGLRLRDHDM